MYVATTVQEVRELFSEHVDVRYVSLPRNRETGNIKGFAFVDLASPDEILKAIDALNEVDMDGRPLRVSLSLPKDQIRSTRKSSMYFFNFVRSFHTD
jgi:RNA recognition motif-containing protein